MDHLHFETPSGRRLTLRDLEPDDIDAIVAYWHEGGADLEYLGIDVAKLGDARATEARFTAALPGGPDHDRMFVLVVAEGRHLGGYINLNVRDDEAYVHMHLIDAALRDGGIASTLLAQAGGVLYDRLAVDRILLEVGSWKDQVVHVLEKAGLPLVQAGYLDDPDGLALPGDFVTYVLPRPPSVPG